MGLQSIVRLYNKPKQLSDLIPMDENLYSILGNYTETGYDDWVKGLTDLGYDVSKIYFHPTSKIDSIFYVDEYFTGKLFDLSLETLGDVFYSNILKMNNMYKKMLLEDKNYYMYFFPEGNPFATDYFKKYYHLIPKEELVSVFIEMYVSLETGFEYLPMELVHEILSLVKQGDVDNLLLDTYGTTQDTYTIYRGVHEDSSNVETALSWTLSKEVAEWFSERIGNTKENIYKATVKKEDILYFIDLRNEEEVLVKYDDLTNVEFLGKSVPFDKRS